MVIAKEGSAAGEVAVADAVKCVADAAVAEVTKTAPEVAGDFIITGSPRFEIRGAGFSTGGTVSVNGKQAHTTGWGSMKIEGVLPEGAKPGDVVEVIVDKDTRQRAILR